MESIPKYRKTNAIPEMSVQRAVVMGDMGDILRLCFFHRSMKALRIAIVSALLLTACGKAQPAKNPDPNHTHADFAVWIEGKQIDFSLAQYMSGSSDEHDAEHTRLDQYLHLHDNNGHVIHRHKPGLTLSEFFSTLPGMRYQGTEFKFMDCMTCQHASGTYVVKLFVNGKEEPKGSAYAFNDDDKLLITDAIDPAEQSKQINSLTDDACLYSKTCPERGKPPTENCIADPTVPCVVQ
jgi:hypothetical protein